MEARAARALLAPAGERLGPGPLGDAAQEEALPGRRRRVLEEERDVGEAEALEGAVHQVADPEHDEHVAPEPLAPLGHRGERVASIDRHEDQHAGLVSALLDQPDAARRRRLPGVSRPLQRLAAGRF